MSTDPNLNKDQENAFLAIGGLLFLALAAIAFSILLLVAWFFHDKVRRSTLWLAGLIAFIVQVSAFVFVEDMFSWLRITQEQRENNLLLMFLIFPIPAALSFSIVCIIRDFATVSMYFRDDHTPFGEADGNLASPRPMQEPAPQPSAGFAGSGYQGNDFGLDGTQAAMSGGRRTMGGGKRHATDDDGFAFDDSVFDRPEPTSQYRPTAPSKAARNLIPYVRRHRDGGVEKFSEALDAMAKTTATEMVKQAINDPTVSPEDRAFLRRLLSYREGGEKRAIGQEKRRMIAGR